MTLICNVISLPKNNAIIVISTNIHTLIFLKGGSGYCRISPIIQSSIIFITASSHKDSRKKNKKKIGWRKSL